MTPSPDPLDPLDPVDERASALVDGVAEGEVTAEVEARAATFRRVVAAVGADDAEPVDEARREEAIAAALAAFSPPVADLAARRAARGQWLKPLGVAAAVLAAVAIGGVALQGSGGDDSDDSATAADVTAAEESAADSDSGAGNDSGELLEASTFDLGPYESLDDLVAAANANAVASRGSGVASGGGNAGGGTGSGGDAQTSAPTTTAAASDDGTTVLSSEPAPAFPGLTCPPPDGGVVYAASARIQERPVEVYVTGDGDVVVLDAGDCSVVED